MIDNSTTKFFSLVVQIYLAGLVIANSFEKTASDCWRKSCCVTRTRRVKPKIAQNWLQFEQRYSDSASSISSVKYSPANAIKISAAIFNLFSFSLFDRRDRGKPKKINICGLLDNTVIQAAFISEVETKSMDSTIFDKNAAITEYDWNAVLFNFLRYSTF